MAKGKGAKPPKKPYGKYSPEEYRRHLTEFESLYGSQKKAAEKLGISPSTFRKHKAGKISPDKARDTIAKVNKRYGANKKKIQTPEVQAKANKREEKQVEQQKRREFIKSTTIHKLSTREWIAEVLVGMSALLVRQISNISSYVAYQGGNNLTVQFWEPPEEPNGKPAGQRRAKAWAIYTELYLDEAATESGRDPRRMLIGSPVPLLNDIDSEWSIDRVNDYIEDHFQNRVEMKNRTKFKLSRYLGFQLY